MTALFKHNEVINDSNSVFSGSIINRKTYNRTAVCRDHVCQCAKHTSYRPYAVPYFKEELIIDNHSTNIPTYFLKAGDISVMGPVQTRKITSKIKSDAQIS